jgi:hypothetical protein
MNFTINIEILSDCENEKIVGLLIYLKILSKFQGINLFSKKYYKKVRKVHHQK